MDSISPVSTGELVPTTLLAIPTTQATGMLQTVSQETTTIAGSSNSSTGPDPAPFGLNEHQEFHQEMMQMMMDLLNQHEHQWQLSQPPADPTNLMGHTGSTTSTDATA